MADKPKFVFVGAIQSSAVVTGDMYRLSVVGAGQDQGKVLDISFNSLNFQKQAPHADWALVAGSIGTGQVLVFEGTINGDYYNGRKAKVWDGQPVAAPVAAAAPAPVAAPVPAAAPAPVPAGAPAPVAAPAPVPAAAPAPQPQAAPVAVNPEEALRDDIWRAIAIALPRLPEEVPVDPEKPTGKKRPLDSREKANWLNKAVMSFLVQHSRVLAHVKANGLAAIPDIEPPTEAAPAPAPEPAAAPDESGGTW